MFSPDAVYLNGSGQELSEDDGSGAWWVKHSWELGGEGYDNSELKPMADYPSFYVEGKLLSDGITMKIGATEFGHNFRWPVYGKKDKDVSYRVQRWMLSNKTTVHSNIWQVLICFGNVKTKQVPSTA